jgi:hypothetical protein
MRRGAHQEKANFIAAFRTVGKGLAGDASDLVGSDVIPLVKHHPSTLTSASHLARFGERWSSEVDNFFQPRSVEIS